MVADLQPRKKRSFKIPPGLMTTDAGKILNDPDIEIVVELIGGTTIAKDVILASMRNGKHVVTANKALVSKYGLELHDAAHACKVDFYYEASVCGGIPIIKSIREGLTADRIDSVRGIVNGTCNYILTRMTDDGLSFKDAMKDARKYGYAEADPSLDIDGIDSMHKIGILAANSFGQWVPRDMIYVEGISNISALDIMCAGELGYTVKLLAIARIIKKKLEVRVHPTLLPKQSMLASVRGAFNAVEVDGHPIGRTLYYGEGAGMNATSSAVVADIVDIARNIGHESHARMPTFTFMKKEIPLRKIDDVEYRYFLRWRTDDRPGVIAKISRELSKRDIGISSVILHEFAKVQPYSIVTFMSRETTEKKMRAAIKSIDTLDVIQTKTSMIRVELVD
jgi:homoserine dehydrogenase